MIINDESKIQISNENVTIDKINANANIEISGDVVINILFVTIKEINFYLLKNSSLIFNNLDYLNSQDVKINYFQKDNSKLVVNNAIFVNSQYNMVVNNILDGNNINSKININLITEKVGNAKIFIQGEIKKSTRDNVFLQNVKCLNFDEGMCEVIPNMLIATSEVQANHNVTIGTIDSNYLFYLMGKGLSKDVAVNLIKKGFLINNLKIDEQLKEQIKNNIF